MSEYQMLRWAVGDEQVNRALASVWTPEERDDVIRRLAAGDTIDAAGNWTPAKRFDAAEWDALVAAQAAEWVDAFRPNEALRSRDSRAL